MPRSLRLPLLALTMTVAATSPSGAQLFVFPMSGSQEVPPVASPANGGCMGTFSGADTFALTCVHDVANATMIHIHHPDGSVAFDLGSPASPVVATWTGMAPADVAELLADALYVNIHTAGRPAGEIRGQIDNTVDSVTFPLDGSQVVPPSGSPSTGACTADLNVDGTQLSLSCTHDVAAPETAHVHLGAAGTNGPDVFTFASAASPLAETMAVTPQRVAELAATFLYLDVHGTPSGGGDEEGGDEIRGQMGALPVAPTTGTIRIVKSTLPAGGTGFDFTTDVPGGPAAFSLDDTGTQVFISVPAGTYNVTELDPLASGFTVSAVECDDADSSGNPFARTATVALQASEVVTCTFTNQSTAAGGDLYVFGLGGDQEVPPVPTPDSGGCAARLNGTTLTIFCVHDIVGASLIHVHRGPAGTNGPALFDLGDPSSPVQAEWVGMTPGDLADLSAGNLYVNIHTGGRPAGAIRGQIVPRTVDSVSFPLEGAQEVPPTFSPALGWCFADLSADGGQLALSCTHDLAEVTDAHLHEGPAGVEGPVVLMIPGASPIGTSVPMTLRLLADFAAGFLYVNLHSVDLPTGEIRGQLVAGGASSVVAIPTLGQWAAGFLALALLGLGLRRLSGG